MHINSKLETLNICGITSPLDQFEIRDLINLNAPILGDLHLSLTNIGLYLIIGGCIAFYLSIIATNFNRVVSNN
jgi:molybdopterin/thiamine biosynthesis adenylyltransferase